MERSIFCGQRKTECMELDYYIITNYISKEYCDLKSYGIRIVKTVYFDGGGKSIESNQLNNIFYRSCDIEKFMKTLINNMVTPMSLRDAVEDYIIESMDEAGCAAV